MHEEPEQVPSLVRSRDIARLVLHPDGGPGPEPVGQPGRGGERCHGEAVPVDPRHLAVEMSDQLDERTVSEAARRGEMVGVEKTAPPDERVRFRGLPREVQLADVEEPAQDVVTAITGTRAQRNG